MKILLLQDRDTLGSSGDVVTVKDGYARNFLIPAGYAIKADPRNLKAIEARRKQAKAHAVRSMSTHHNMAERLAGLELIARVQVGEEDRMFGAVTSADIAALLDEQGIEIDRRIIKLDEPIKALGEYSVPVKLHAEVEAAVKIRVVPEEA